MQTPEPRCVAGRVSPACDPLAGWPPLLGNPRAARSTRLTRRREPDGGEVPQLGLQGCRLKHGRRGLQGGAQPLFAVGEGEVAGGERLAPLDLGVAHGERG